MPPGYALGMKLRAQFTAGKSSAESLRDGEVNRQSGLGVSVLNLILLRESFHRSPRIPEALGISAVVPGRPKQGKPQQPIV